MTPIPLLNLTRMLVPLIAVAVVAQRWAGKGREFGYATLRMVLQLAVVGYALAFIFDQQSGVVGIGLLSFMLTIAAVIGTRNVRAGSYRVMVMCMVPSSAGLSVIVYPYSHAPPAESSLRASADSDA